MTAEAAPQPLPLSAKGCPLLVAEVHLSLAGVDVGTLHHQPLVEVAHHTAVGQPADHREGRSGGHHRRLKMEPGPNHRWFHQRGVEDQTVYPFWPPGQVLEGDPRTEAETAEVKALQPQSLDQRLERSGESRAGVAAGSGGLSPDPEGRG